MRKSYILDTSVLIADPYAHKSFSNSEVIIPITVLNELDNLKKQPSEAGKHARVAIRVIDEISTSGDVTNGILLDDDILFRIDADYYDPHKSDFAGFGDPTYGDTNILICAYVNKISHIDNDATLVSNDINLRIKARSRGINAISYNTNNVNVNELYSGIKIVNDVDAGIMLQETSVIDPRLFRLELNPHECVMFKDDDGNDIALGRKVSADKVKLVKKYYPWGIAAKNTEQACAIDLLMDKNIDLLTLSGKAGTGKTLIALACALELVLNKKEYDKLIIYRPIQSVGSDIGYLPGPQPLDAKILTPNGWSTMGEIMPNDFIIGSDGEPKKVLKIFPKGEKEVFKVTFSDGSSTECCEDHLWFTTSLKESQRKSKRGSVKSLKEIKDTLKVYKTQVNNHKIPLLSPVNFESKNVAIHPYILGVLLGDGTLTEDYSVYFTSSDEEISQNCSKLIPEDMVCKIKNKVSNSYSYSFVMKDNVDNKHRKNNPFPREIKKLGLLGSKSGTKFIPNDYKINSIQSRIDLLQGLMDTDGFVSEDGSDVVYTTTSKTLATDVQFIVQSLGGLAKINIKKSSYTYNEVEKDLTSYNVSISLPQNICPFRLSRKVKRFKSRKYDLHRMITDITPVGIKETKCILVESEDHLYATDNFILTHNTMEEKLSPWFQAIMDNFEFLFGAKGSTHSDWRRSFEMFQRKGQIELNAITYIRGRSIPNSIILVDETQNLSSAEIKTLLTRAGSKTRIWLTGDIDQIDAPHLSSMDNGLTYTVDKFKTHDIAGHVTFTKGERSRLATLASNIL